MKKISATTSSPTVTPIPAPIFVAFDDGCDWLICDETGEEGVAGAGELESEDCRAAVAEDWPDADDCAAVRTEVKAVCAVDVGWIPMVVNGVLLGTNEKVELEPGMQVLPSAHESPAQQNVLGSSQAKTMLPPSRLSGARWS